MIQFTQITSCSREGKQSCNEDALGANPKGTITVCDGVEGHGYAREASSIVVKEFTNSLKADCADYRQAITDVTSKAIRQMNKKQTDLQNKNSGAGAPMATTLLTALSQEEELIVIHAGHSRAYLFNSRGRLVYRSKDHSVAQLAADAEILTEEECRRHPRRQQLTNCLMAGTDEARLTVEHLRIAEDDILLLCTDGVVEAFSDDLLEQTVRTAATFKEASEKIVAGCEERSTDNYSFYLIGLSQSDTAFARWEDAPLLSSEELVVDLH